VSGMGRSRPCRCPAPEHGLASIAPSGRRSPQTFLEPADTIVDKERPGIMAFAGLGMLNAVCLALGLVGGWLIDRALGTLPLFLFIGLIAGIAMGVLATRAEWKRYF
jgi:hypothetical protein